MCTPENSAQWFPRVALAGLASPLIAIFISSNVVNLGNLGFNMIFSRLMGPELFGDLAVLLTLKLGVLGVLGAVQMAVSQKVASANAEDPTAAEDELGALAAASFLVLWFALPAIGAVIWVSDIDRHLGLSSESLLLILILSLPFTMPLAIGRGISLGRMNTVRIIASANAEMLTRLVGCWVMWSIGFGIEGVALAISLSIVVGLIALGRPGRIRTGFPQVDRRAMKSLLLASLPFAALQIGQVVLLDGDILIAKLYLDANEAGYVAALTLFQRIQFFGCFALAGVLLPAVSNAHAEGKSGNRALFWTIALFTAVSIILFGTSILVPEDIVSLLVGVEFVPAAEALHLAIISAIGFTLSYLLATYFTALGDHMGIWLIVLLGPFQLGTMGYYASQHAQDLEQLLAIKASALTALSIALIIYGLLREIRIEHAPQSPQTKH